MIEIILILCLAAIYFALVLVAYELTRIAEALEKETRK